MHMHDIYTILNSKIVPLLLALIGFNFLVGIHEFGHYIFCKLFGIHTPTFSIGFGPEIFSKKIGSTNFRLAAIPFGGYCEIAGLAEVGQGSQDFASDQSERSFSDKPYWQKLLVMSGGILFNFLFAYIVFCSLFMIGSSEQQAVIVGGVVKNSAAETYGLQSGDAIIAIDGKELKDADGTLNENAQDILLASIRSNPNKSLVFKIERTEKLVDLPITLGAKNDGGTEIGSLGAELRTPMPKLQLAQAVKRGVQETHKQTMRIVESIKHLITKRSLEGAGGPLMIISMSFGAAQHGIMALLIFLALLSINLALFNLLPLGALDGGQILFETIEAIIRRRIPLIIRNSINIASWLLFIGLALFLTYKDLAYLIGDRVAVLVKKLIGLVR